jgi:DNA polymerase-3 subunit delta
MDSLLFLERVGGFEVQPIYVLHGDEDFLKRRVLAAVRILVLGRDGDAFGLADYDGEKAAFAAVHDELATLPFLNTRRLVVVHDADAFVTRNRSALEKYAANPAPTGVLVLEVKSWPSNTRLYKLVDADGTLACKAPPAYKLPAWCIQWAASEHGKQLSGPAAELLVQLIGADMGQLDQELTKLALYVGQASRIDVGDVDRLVGCSRTENTWKIFDAVAQGQPAEALAILDRALEHGEEPIRILGAFSMQLRRLAQAARLTQMGQPLRAALEQVGVSSYNARSCEQQLRYLGRRRIDRLYDWLLEVDLGLKGSSQLPARTVLEKLVVQLARKNQPMASR